MPSVAVEHARQQWEEGHRRLQAYAHDRALYSRLYAQVDAITEELRRRVGQTFTLADLAEAYRDAERWTREVAASNARPPAGVGHLALVEDAAFHIYARGALDYAP